MNDMLHTLMYAEMGERQKKKKKNKIRTREGSSNCSVLEMTKNPRLKLFEKIEAFYDELNFFGNFLFLFS